jgi:tyrosine-protein kinase Etk/Wzc
MTPAPPDDDSVDLLKIVAILVREWPIGLAVTTLILVLGAAYTYTITPLFESSAVILPQSQQTESSSLASIFGGGRSSGDLYIGLLKSRSVADFVVTDLGLMDVYKTHSRIDARTRLLGSMKFVSTPDTLITITARDRDSTLSTRIANAFVEGLQRQGETMEVRQAAEHQKIYDIQLDQERAALAQAETDLRDIQQKTGVVEAGSQTQAGLAAIAAVRSQITALQVQLAGLLQGATENNPEVRTLNSQIARLQAQEATLESNSAGRAGAPSAAGSVPEVSLEVARRQREVRYHEGLVNSLASRYQTERMAQASGGLAFSVVDPAEKPEKKAWPPRRTFLLFTAFAAFLLGLFAIIAAVIARKIWADPLERAHLFEIRNAALRRT